MLVSRSTQTSPPSYVADVLSQVADPATTGVQVIIGGEGRWEELKDCAIIVGRYGADEDLSGTLAVLGPTRMPYGRNISAVRYVADIMSSFIFDYYLDKSLPGESSGGDGS